MAVWTYAQIEQLWIANGGDPSAAPVAAAIAMAESGGGNDQALNNDPNTGDYSVGLWQTNYYGALMQGRTAQFGSPQDLLSNANAQAHSAVVISGNGTDWTPWTTYTHGLYKQYLSGAAPSGAGSPTDTGALTAAAQGGSSAPDVNVGNQAAAPYKSSAIPGIPSDAPPFPDFTANPTNELGRVLSWTGEFAGWAFFIVLIFIVGFALFTVGALVLVVLLASPAVGPMAAAVGSKSVPGKAASFLAGAATERATTRRDNRMREGTSEPKSARQAQREGEAAANAAGVSRPGPGDRRTGSQRLRVDQKTAKGRRVVLHGGHVYQDADF